MGKSEGNIITVETLTKEGFNPLAYRYLCLTCHYRAELNFSFPILKSGQNALVNLYQKVQELKYSKLTAKKEGAKEYKKKFLEFINEDLNAPKALALMWNLIKNKGISNKEKYRLILDFDKVLGLNLAKIKKTKEKIPQNVLNLAKQREKFRKENNWQKADQIREEIKKMSYRIEDTSQGPKIRQIK